MSVSIRSNQTGISYNSRQQQQIANLSNKSSLVSSLTASLPSRSGSGSGMGALTMNILNGGGDSMMSDYASIKNGSYKKLMKAYYSEVGQKTTKEEVEESLAEKGVKTKDSKAKTIKSEELTGKDTAKKDTADYVYKKDGTKSLSDLVDGSFQTFA